MNIIEIEYLKKNETCNLKYDLFIYDFDLMSHNGISMINTDRIKINNAIRRFEIFNYIKADSEMLEREPIARLVKNRELSAYKHEGFWQCMDTKRDHEKLTERFAADPVWLK